MTIDEIKRLLSEGEGLTVEFKQCRDSLNNSVFETVSSFSNRYGGYIPLGVGDDGAVIGVNRSAVADMKKNFANMLNNPQKISPTLFLRLEEIEIDDRLLLWVYVPPSSQVELCASRVFDRTEDADVDITTNTALVANLYQRKSSLYTEREVFPYAEERHLRFDLMPRVRQMAVNRHVGHPWGDMTDMEIMKSAGLYEDDLRTGKKGFNLAAILLFGQDEAIRSCAPGYATDALLRRDNLDRYDDRLIVATNLIESFDLLMGFIEKHTLDRFFLIGDRNVSVRSWIARELVSNILVHREYSSAFRAKIVIEHDRICSENWNRAVRPGRIDPERFSPLSKNPLLAQFFMNIGYADQLGSGVRNLYRYTKIYSGGEPELIEGDVFRTIIPLTQPRAEADAEPEVAEIIPKSLTDFGKDFGINFGKDFGINDTQKKIVELIQATPEITTQEMADDLNLTTRSVEYNLSTLKEIGLIQRIGTRKAGKWIVLARKEAK
ncbi:MAG: putative DNA binding domain-containing protein [Acidobacteriota bacterium]|jgi:ATP-dependent DNA helicase RecG|nr:putative DNA binding domain-containing protein [Acidobacteriota bacterium]